MSQQRILKHEPPGTKSEIFSFFSFFVDSRRVTHSYPCFRILNWNNHIAIVLCVGQSKNILKGLRNTHEWSGESTGSFREFLSRNLKFPKKLIFFIKYAGFALKLCILDFKQWAMRRIWRSHQWYFARFPPCCQEEQNKGEARES